MGAVGSIKDAQLYFPTSPRTAAAEAAIKAASERYWARAVAETLADNMPARTRRARLLGGVSLTPLYPISKPL